MLLNVAHTQTENSPFLDSDDYLVAKKKSFRDKSTRQVQCTVHDCQVLIHCQIFC